MKKAEPVRVTLIGLIAISACIITLIIAAPSEFKPLLYKDVIRDDGQFISCDKDTRIVFRYQNLDSISFNKYVMQDSMSGKWIDVCYTYEATHDSKYDMMSFLTWEYSNSKRKRKIIKPFYQ